MHAKIKNHQIKFVEAQKLELISEQFAEHATRIETFPADHNGVIAEIRAYSKGAQGIVLVVHANQAVVLMDDGWVLPIFAGTQKLFEAIDDPD